MSILSHKETDLQKVIMELKASLKDKELQELADNVLAQMNTSSENPLSDPSLQATLQGLLQNRNLTDLLSTPNLSSQIINFLNTPGSGLIIEQLKNAFNTNDSEKKKINREDHPEDDSHFQTADSSVISNDTSDDLEQNWAEILKPYLTPQIQQTIDFFYTLLLITEIMEIAGNIVGSLSLKSAENATE